MTASDDFSGASGSLLGSNVLQSVMNTLTTAINRLATSITSTSSTFPAPVNPFPPNTAPSAIGNMPMQSSQPRTATGQFAPWSAATAFPPSWISTGAFPPVQNPFMTGAPGGATSAQGPFVSAFPPPASQSIPAGPQQVPSAFTSFPRPVNPFVAAGAGIGAAAAFAGAGMLGTQGVMSAYYQQAALGAPLGQSPSTTNALLQYAAFGSGTTNANAIALNPLDAAQGGLALNYVAGSYNPLGTQAGQAAYGAQSAFGYVNPQLGAAGGAAMAAAVYNPVTSMSMRALGYRVTPRTLGGGPRAGMGAIVRSLIQGSNYGQSRVKQSTLVSELGQGGVMGINLGAIGFNQSQVASMAPLVEAYNKLANAGYTPGKADALFTQARHNTGNAQGILNSLDIQKSVWQDTKDVNAQKTLRSADLSSSYDHALQTSTTLLTGFNKALTGILTKLGLMPVIGGATGFMGGLKTMIGGGIGGVGIGTGIGLVSKLFGGGGLGGALGGVGGALGGVGDAVGGGAAALGSAAVAALPAAALLFGLSKVHHPNGKSWLQEGPGGANAWWNNGGVFDRDVFGGGRGSGYYTGFGGSASSQPNIGGGAGTTSQTSMSSSAGGSSKSNGGSVPKKAQEAVHTAERYIGTPYVWGGDSPAVGFDCSGLVEYAYAQAGVQLPRRSQDQWDFLKRRSVSLKDVQEGDIVFTAGSDGTASAPGHEGMMISKTHLIQAPMTGQDVQIIPFHEDGWDHAGRPVGSLSGSASANGGLPSQTSGGIASLSGLAGNAGLGISEGSMYSTDNESGALGGGGGMGAGGLAASTIGSSAGGKNAGTPPPARNASARRAQAVAKELAKSYGWSSGRQWNDLVALWQQESSWMWNAENPGAGHAYGIPQALPPDKMRSAGADWRTDAATQIKWGLGYIMNRYGSPKNAWAHEESVGWYAKGTKHAMRGPAMVGENGPELVYMSGGESVVPNAMGGMLPPVNINFAKGAIQVSALGSSDASASGREIATTILDNLTAENIYAAIGLGQKN